MPTAVGKKALPKDTAFKHKLQGVCALLDGAPILEGLAMFTGGTKDIGKASRLGLMRGWLEHGFFPFPFCPASAATRTGRKRYPSRPAIYGCYCARERRLL
jgi:hypothetical protein